jgi:DNA-3-methyladenine glycosylase I
MNTRIRCPWAESSALMRTYHDTEWGAPVHDDRLLFEALILDGAQAGLSWSTILARRETYRAAFASFDPKLIAAFDEQAVSRLLLDPGIIRNRRKIESAVGNARAFLDIQKEFGSFDRYIWRFTSGSTIRNAWRTPAEIPAETSESKEMSRDLKKRGFCFVGPTICYAYMQAIGMVNDHVTNCFRHTELG